MKAKDLIEKLQLIPHPEGGYYKQTYRSTIEVSVEGNMRHMCTSIYYLLEDDNISHFHRIKSEELWFFHMGEALEIVILDTHNPRTIILGNEIDKGEVPQAFIPANTWFGSRVKNRKGFTLVSCTVAPGFDFADFELAKKHDLLTLYPQLEELIKQFTYQ